MGRDNVDEIYLAEDREKWQTFMNTVVNLRPPE
jgi:hypothetical protein